jgi:transposase
MSENENDHAEIINARPRVEVLDSVERRRRWTAEEKQVLLKEADQPGNSMSSVARKYGVSTSQMFAWRKQFQKGGQVAIRSNDDVVPANDLKAAQCRIRELERQLGRKTMETEILKEAISIAREKKLLSRAQLQKAEDILGQL